MKLPPWALLLIGAISGAAIVVAVQLFTNTLKLPDGFGTVVGSATAAISAVLAWSGFARWETRHRKERQAEAAAKGLVAAWEFSFHLGLLTSTDFSQLLKQLTQVPIGLMAEQQDRLAKTQVMKQLNGACAQAAAYLDPESLDALNHLRSLGVEFVGALASAQHEYPRESDQYLSINARDTLLAALEPLREKVEPAYDAVRERLRRYALLHDD